ncbi:MAG: cell wall-binding repeat-containing protein [Actinobacteria bacterium]|nr:cell wall-binding repeat-containing protein [Actinomycetota bacterium]
MSRHAVRYARGSAALLATLVSGLVLALLPAVPASAQLPITTVDIGGGAIHEGDDGTKFMAFRAVLRQRVDTTVTVQYQTADVGSATGGSSPGPGVDYLHQSGTLTFNAGDVRPSPDPILVPIRGDTDPEADEIFEVKLTTLVQTTSLGVRTGVGRIIDDDDPTLTLVYPAASPPPSEGDAVVSFEVEADAINDHRVMTVDWRTVDPASADAAQPGVDYARVARGTVTIPRGSTKAAVEVPLIDDTLDEAAEDVTVELIANSASGASVGATDTATVAIQDDDLPILSIDQDPDPTVEPGSEEAATATFVITVAGELEAPATVMYETVAVTATAGEDFDAVPPTELELAPGTGTLASIDVRVLGDGAVEGDETFQVRLTGPVGVRLGQDTATATIVDTDSPPQVRIGDAGTVTEGAGATARFPVTLGRPTTEDVDVTLQVVNGTTTSGDYSVATPTVTIPAGETSTEFPVAITNDTAAEDHETFHADIAGVSADAVIGSPSRGTATIVSDDGPTLSVQDPAAIDEGDGTGTTQMSFPVTLTGSGHTGTVTAAWTTVDGTATAIDGDYIPAQGIVTFPVGVTEQTITVLVAADDRDEGGNAETEAVETVQVTISDARYGKIGNATGSGDITDDDHFPLLDIADVRVQEGDSGTAQTVFRVELSDATDADVTIAYRTVDGTAISGTGDYTAEATTPFVPAGQRHTDITVDVTADAMAEINETFALLLTRARNVDLPTPEDTQTTDQARRGTGTILNDDGPHLRIGDASTLERDGNETHPLNFEVHLLEGGNNTVTVSFATGNGEVEDDGARGGDSADPPLGDVDFVHHAGTVTFAPGEATKTVPVSIVGDDHAEATEWFRVALSEPATETTATAATLLDGEGIGTIVNDDGKEIRIADVQVVEGDSGRTDARLEVTLDEPSTHEVTVDYSTHGVTAIEGADFEATSGRLTVPGTIIVPVIGDTFDEGDHTFEVRLSRPRFGELVDDVATVTIRDDDGDGGGTTGGSTGGSTGDGTDGTTGDATTGGTTGDTTGGTTGDTTGGTTGSGAPLPQRSAGLDRISTAIAVSRDHWIRADAAVLATARNYPDALAAAAIAHGLEGPLLLTDVDALPEAVLSELRRLEVSQVWIMGGPMAISTVVERQLREAGLDVVRVAGRDRFETAALAARSIGLPPNGDVSLALGVHTVPDRAWPDALSAGSLAATPAQLPTLLTHGNGLPGVTAGELRALGAREVQLLGGPAAVSSDVVAALRASGHAVTRLEGSTRYGTSVAVAEEALARHGPGRIPVVFATGEDFPDGLTAGALAAQLGGVIVLVPSDHLATAPEVSAFLRAHRERLGGAVIVGGPVAVSEAVRQQLATALGGG